MWVGKEIGFSHPPYLHVCVCVYVYIIMRAYMVHFLSQV